MNQAVTRGALRVIAIAIAVTALIDPAFSSSAAPAPPVIAVHLTAVAPEAVDRALRQHLGGRELITRRSAGSRVPCAADEDCIVIADGSTEADVDTTLVRPISLIAMRPDGQPNVSVQSVVLSGGHRSAAGAARVELSGQGVEGKRTELRIVDGASVVRTATHQWSSATTAAIDMAWWPVELGARALRVEAVPIEGEATAIDNQIDAGVTIATERSPILVFDARPSWTSTFVRRALEDDRRLTVQYRSRVAPALSTGTSSGRLDAATLDLVSMIVVGSPEALAPEEVALLDRYVRIRGGTLVLLPEHSQTGAASSLFRGVWTEHLTADAEAIGPLRATEILRAADSPVTTTVIARSEQSPVIVSLPAGEGRIIVSGAMDAWRYRGLDATPSTSPRAGAFDRFWRSLAAEGASAGDGLTLAFDQNVAARGSRVRFVLRDRRFEPRASVEASAVLRCNDGAARSIRVWPSGVLGEFTGEVPAAVAGYCTIEATVDDRHALGAIAVVDRPRRGAELTLARLERLARATGGTVGRAGEEERILRAIGSHSSAMSRGVSVYPMRAPWWIIAFAGCVSAEWWLRRRQGLR